MRESEIVDAVVEYYEGKLAAFGGTARGVDWKDEASQIKRFEQLTRGLGLSQGGAPFSLIDFGCGYGALLPFLARHGFAFTYTGYDPSRQMIAEARRIHADVRGVTFTSEWAAVAPADYAVASGVFNVRLGMDDHAWRAYVLLTLERLSRCAALGWAVNFLTSYSDDDRKRPDLYYPDPLDIFDWCKRSISRWVWLLHDYELYEFTIGVTHSPR